MPEGSRRDLEVLSEIASNDSTYDKAKRTYRGSSARTKMDQQTMATAAAVWHEDKIRLQKQLKELQSDAKSHLEEARREITRTITSQGTNAASQR